MGNVVVLGSLNIDLVLQVAGLPAPGETVLSARPTRRPGGKGANQAIAAAAAGASTTLIGRVGAHDDGPAYRAALADHGVDVSGLLEDASTMTGLAVVVVDPAGENLIVVSPGANSAIGPEDISRAHLAHGDVLLLQLEIPFNSAIAAIGAAHDAGATVALNLSPYHDVPPDTLARCDVVIVNRTEAKRLANTRLDPSRLVTTAGPDGAAWGDLIVAAPSVDPVIDTTGAGDALAGVLAAGLALHRSRADALTDAVAAGSACVRHAGAQPWTL